MELEMLVRINPKLESTEDLLAQVLQVILPDASRVSFLCAAGDGERVLARLRVMVSRRREMLRRKGRKPKIFTLKSSVHPETHAGIRYDSVIIWREIKDSDWMSEELEDMMAKEKTHD